MSQSNEKLSQNPYVFATVSRQFTRDEVLGLQIFDEKSHKNKGAGENGATSELFIFADKSESLEGPPFHAVKQGCLSMCKSIFSSNEFNKVHFIWYNNNISPAVHTSEYSLN